MSLLASDALEAICKAGTEALAVCTTFNLAPGAVIPIPKFPPLIYESPPEELIRDGFWPELPVTNK